jgi:hypothetical protein
LFSSAQNFGTQLLQPLSLFHEVFKIEVCRDANIPKDLQESALSNQVRYVLRLTINEKTLRQTLRDFGHGFSLRVK